MLQPQILTVRQQQELNKAIIQYIKPIAEEANDGDLIQKLSESLDVPLGSIDDSVIPNYLEKKWSTVLRLQHKIIDLEGEVSNLRTVIDSQQIVPSASASVIGKDKINWLPSSSIKAFKTQSHQLVQSVSIHPTLPIILGGCSDGSLIIWNLVNDESLIPEKIIKAHIRGVNTMAWSKKPVDLSGKGSEAKGIAHVIATCSSDLSIKIWDGATFKHIRTLTGHEHTISSIVFSDSKPNILYSVSRDKSVKVWDLVNGYCIKTFIGHSDWVRDIDVISVNSNLLQEQLDINPELGDFLVTCSNDQSIRLSHAESGTGLSLSIGHTHVIECVKFLPFHSNYIIDKYIKENESLFPNISLEVLDDPNYTNLLGYKYCISGGRDNSVKLWLLPPPVFRPHRHPLPSQLNNSQGWLIADLVGHQSWVKSLHIHPNGRFVFSGSDDKTIKVWDLASLNVNGRVKCVKNLIGHEGFVNDIEFASFEITNNIYVSKIADDGKTKTEEDRRNELTKSIESKIRCLFISGGVDNCIRLWS